MAFLFIFVRDSNSPSYEEITKGVLKMSLVKSLLGKIDVSKVHLKLKKEKKEKPTLLKEVMNNPEAFKLEAVIENEEIVIKIKRKDES